MYMSNAANTSPARLARINTMRNARGLLSIDAEGREIALTRADLYSGLAAQLASNASLRERVLRTRIANGGRGY